MFWVKALIITTPLLKLCKESHWSVSRLNRPAEKNPTPSGRFKVPRGGTSRASLCAFYISHRNALERMKTQERIRICVL